MWLCKQWFLPQGEKGTHMCDRLNPLRAPFFVVCCPSGRRSGRPLSTYCKRLCNWRRRRIVRCTRFRFLTVLHSALNGIRTWNVGCFRISKWGVRSRHGWLGAWHWNGNLGRRTMPGVIHFHGERVHGWRSATTWLDLSNRGCALMSCWINSSNPPQPNACVCRATTVTASSD